MIRHALGLRLDSSRPVRDQIHEAAMGARGVVLEAIGDLSPLHLSETGRRELRHLLRTMELSLVAPVFPPGGALTRPTSSMIGSAAPTWRLPSPTSWGRAWCWPGSGRFHPRTIESGARLSLARSPRWASGPIIGAFAWLSRPARSRGSGSDVPRFAGHGQSRRQRRPREPAPRGIDPVATSRELSTWVAHAYAGDATGSAGGAAPNPRGLGFPAGALDWEEYLGASRRSVTAAFSPSGPIPRRIRASGSPRLLSGSNGSAEKRCRGEREAWSVRREAWSVISLLGFTGHYALVRAGLLTEPVQSIREER